MAEGRTPAHLCQGVSEIIDGIVQSILTLRASFRCRPRWEEKRLSRETSSVKIRSRREECMSQVLNNRYLVVSKLGQGGMGAVYKAQDTQLGNRLVAVKEMLQVGTDKQGIQEAAMAFKKEADLLARLQHPNLPSVYAHFQERGRSDLVMRYTYGDNIFPSLSQQARQ